MLLYPSHTVFHHPFHLHNILPHLYVNSSRANLSGRQTHRATEITTMRVSIHPHLKTMCRAPRILHKPHLLHRQNNNTLTKPQHKSRTLKHTGQVSFHPSCSKLLGRRKHILPRQLVSMNLPLLRHASQALYPHPTSHPRLVCQGIWIS